MENNAKELLLDENRSINPSPFNDAKMDEYSESNRTYTQNFRASRAYDMEKSDKLRRPTLHIRSNFNRNISFLIPFDMDRKLFFISNEDISGLDLCNYLQATLNKFNERPEFQIHIADQMKGFPYFLQWLFFIIIHLLFSYLTFCVWHLLFFNLVLLMTLVKLHIGFQKYLSF